MITKIYAIHGKSTVSVRIPTGKSGKAFILCEFQRGRPVSGSFYRPATYATSSEIEQLIIENSPYFKNKTIVLSRSFGTAEKPKAAAAETTVNTKEPTVTIMAEVTDRESLIEALKAHGAKATVLASDEKIQAYIEKNHLAFPNFKF